MVIFIYGNTCNIYRRNEVLFTREGSWCKRHVCGLWVCPNGNLLRALPDDLEKSQGPDMASCEARSKANNGALIRPWQFILTRRKIYL